MVERLPSLGIRGDLCRYLFAPHSFVAVALLLGRSWILRSGRTRHPAHRELHSPFDGFERASAARAGLDSSVVEGYRLRTIGNADGDVGGGGLRAYGRVSAGRARC